jgi:hypothetical protein
MLGCAGGQSKAVGIRLTGRNGALGDMCIGAVVVDGFKVLGADCKPDDVVVGIKPF